MAWCRHFASITSFMSSASATVRMVTLVDSDSHTIKSLRAKESYVKFPSWLHMLLGLRQDRGPMGSKFGI